jgi:hypothetical protein
MVLAIGGCAGSKARSHAEADAPNPVPATDQKILAKALANTKAAETAKVSTSVTMTGVDSKDLPGLYNLAGNGRVDFGTGNSSQTISMPYLDQLTGGGQPIEQRIVNGTAYLKLPTALLVSAGAHPASQWVARDAAADATTDLSALAQAQSDPARQLARLAKVDGNVEGVAKESVRGVLTTHFRSTAAIKGARVPVEVWLDADGVVRRMVVTLPLARVFNDPKLGADAALKVQQDLYGFGSPATISAPPSGQVAPADSITLRAP